MLAKLVKALRKLPGVGEKTAYRYAYAILSMEKDEVLFIAKAISDIKLAASRCLFCNNITDGTLQYCPVCRDVKRDRSRLMIVEDISILDTIERLGDYKGLYYILPFKISLLKEGSLNGLEPILELCGKEGIKEIIVATNPTLDGDMVGIYLAKQLNPKGIKVTRIAYGIPVGVDLGYVDDITLARSLDGRREIV